MTLSALALVWLPPNPLHCCFALGCLRTLSPKATTALGITPGCALFDTPSPGHEPKELGTCLQRPPERYLYTELHGCGHSLLVSACCTGEQNTSRQMASRLQPDTPRPSFHRGYGSRAVPAGSKTVPQPCNQQGQRPNKLKAVDLTTSQRLSAPGAMLQPAKTLKPTSAGSQYAHKYNMLDRLGSLNQRHSSIKPQRSPKPRNGKSHQNGGITQVDSRFVWDLCGAKLRLLCSLTQLESKKVGDGIINKRPKEITLVTGKQQSFGDSNNSTASKGAALHLALHLTRLSTPATIIDTPQPLQALHSQMGPFILKDLYRRLLTSVYSQGAAILTQLTSLATPWVCSPIERNHWATLPGCCCTLQNVLPATLPSSTQAEPASICNPVQRQQTNWQQDPFSAAWANMVAFNKEVRKGSATLFAKAVMHANSNGLLPDDKEDIAATQAFAQGTVPKIASGCHCRIQKQKLLVHNTNGIAYQVLVVAKIHLFAYALVEGIYQTCATFRKWAEMIHEETWGLVLPNLPYVAATTPKLEVLVNYLATLWGNSKDRLCPIIPNIHPFLHQIATLHELQANIEVYNRLHPSSFHCTSTNPCQGHYKSPDIGHVIGSVLAYGPSSVVLQFLEYFLGKDGIPITVVAFILALWQFCLEEWKGRY
ncbi:hypothetical protein RHS01_04272 [Rhizoctonia solani]|uniref:DUF6532 domain-containing protein n=1 Tax=Rhizoctonia solani TaxID=456999 RepID=A0A8H7IGB9_9AGAM|nr:hypothetical protein RHS01_04272 [Rhizoctonia solani]